MADVLRSGWITTGAKNAELEALVCDITGANYAVAFTSATAAMHLLLHALDIGPGDEVITPSMTWVSMPNQIELRGAKPVFVDIDKDTLMTTAERIEPLITERTKLIVPVHFAGASLDLAPLRALAERYDILLVEDAAHAMGAAYQGQPIGQSGTAIFSFHPIKNITTGEGGMLCTDNEQLAQTMRSLRFHGLGVDAFDRETCGRAPQAEVLMPGYKYNLPDMNAVLGLGQLQRLAELNAKRAELAARYLEQLQPIAEITPLGLPDYDMLHCWHLFIIRLDIDRAGIDRDAFMAALKRRNIGSGLHFRAVHEQNFFAGKYYATQPADNTTELDNTCWNAARICSLPLFPAMTADDVDRVVTTIREVLAEAAAKLLQR